MYIVYNVLAFLARKVPRQFAYWVALRLADLSFYRRTDDRNAVISNLRQIYEAKGIKPSDKALRGVARKTFQCFAKHVIDFIRYTHISEKEAKSLVSMEHQEYFDDTIAQGRGAILISAHFGNWELGGAMLGLQGHQITTVYMPERSSTLNKVFMSKRQERGFKLVPYGQAAKGLLKSLRNKEMITLLADRDFSHREDRIPFFGKPARLPRGPAMLSIKTGAPIIPVFVIRQVDDNFLMRYYKPLDPKDFADEYELSCALGKILEDAIGHHPSQWFIFEDFWK